VNVCSLFAIIRMMPAIKKNRGYSLDRKWSSSQIRQACWKFGGKLAGGSSLYICKQDNVKKNLVGGKEV